MALKLFLHPLGPGRARLLIGGARPDPERVALALQRNDGRWLGPHRLWQVMPHWHPVFTAEPVPDGLSLTLDADLVDSIIAVGGAPLQVMARLDGDQDAGVLRIRGPLIGSDAAAPRGAAREPSGETEPAEPSVAATMVTPAAPPDPDLTSRNTQTKARWPWLALTVGLMLVAALGLSWWQGWLGETEVEQTPADTSMQSDRQAEPATDQPADSDLADIDGAVSAPPPDATGIALARAFLAEGPTADAIYARAEQLEQADDCAAAYVLYSEAANRDAALAAHLARRYDPLTHRPSTCIAAPDIPYAIVYFSDAAETGDHEVQRRLGQLMAEHEPSGPTHDAGLAWLRKAAESGDQEAVRLLEELTKSGDAPP